MNKLNGITYNKEQWTIKGSRKDGYTIINNQSSYSLALEGDTIAIEQISDDTFLIYFKFLRRQFRLYRLKISDNSATQEYIHDFYFFIFLTDDIMLFDNTVLYSIKRNVEKTIPGGLNRKNNVTVSKSNNGKDIILIEHEIFSATLNLSYVMVILDAETFEPASQAFSSLRNKLFTLSDDFTFDMLINEDQKYANIIGDFFYKKEAEICSKGKSTLYSQCSI